MKITKINRCLFTLSTILLSIYHSSPAVAITIDEFEGNTVLVAGTNGVPASASPVISSTKAIGGKRSMTAIKTAGTGSLFLSTSNGELKHDQGFNDTGVSIISWDGDDTNDITSPSNPTGLGGINLKEDNNGSTKPADAFILRLASDLGSGLPISLNIYVYSNANSSSRGSVVINPGMPFTDVLIPFNSFVINPAIGVIAPADFTNVGAIMLEISGNNPAYDLVIQNFSTNGECETFPVNDTVYSPCGKCINDQNPNSCVDCEGKVNGDANPGDDCDTGDVGVCADGTYESQLTYVIDQQNCTCKAKTTPTPEICDGLDNDCDGQVEDGIIDACGICGGDGKSCTDCAGTPFGNAKPDVCGVCNGDGKSCLDCAGNPNGSAVKDQCGVCNGDNTSCLECVEIDISDKQFLLDHGAKLHEKLIKRMLKNLTSLDKSSATKSYAKTVSGKAHELQVRNWVISWTFISKIQICGNTKLCTQVSNLSNVNEYKDHSLELLNLGKDVVARLRKLKFNTRKFSKQNEDQHNANITLADEIPKTYSGGCNLS